MSGYVPKILLCGDAAEFYAEVGARPFKIVGQVSFVGEGFNFLRDGKFSLDGEIKNYTELQIKITRGGVDHLIFNKLNDFNMVRGILLGAGFPFDKIMTVERFKALPTEDFFDLDADTQLMTNLRNLPFKTLLDVDAHFAKSQLFTKGFNDKTEIDCICATDLLPIKENIYSRVYKNLAECQFRHYDAALIAEKEPADFDRAFLELENIADVVITFARYGFELGEHIRATLMNFEKVDLFRSFSGEWLFCYRRKPPEDFAMYVVTHKKLEDAHVKKFPEGYRLIHGGKAITADLGYAGDNTGENISHFDFYTNEATSVYWVWKNTAHTIVGFCHYRRFFTTSEDDTFAYEKILTREEALKILENYDVITTTIPKIVLTLREALVCNVQSVEMVKIAESTVRKHLMRTHPDYVDAFDYVFNHSHAYNRHIFIMRRNAFDAYCKFLYSFLNDAISEILRLMPLPQMPPFRQRIVAFFSEHMHTVWLIKNRLRIKELKIMQVPGL